MLNPDLSTPSSGNPGLANFLTGILIGSAEDLLCTICSIVGDFCLTIRSGIVFTFKETLRRSPAPRSRDEVIAATYNRRDV